ncbi:MFS transporter [Usitatibacter palustris]|uniref:L-lactate transporter n=1 Tax=Usitatibacter palustris TaxID=2732487 RepID=A0A6M4HAY2_9PROT|nr:MFS transporter [Usitatibacter palustris]QJR15803.1 L-lactate transporter [Usitatibacter palustris]
MNGKSVRTVLICAAAILFIAMGVRQTMGLFLPQMTIANGWTREDFAFAIALQNLLWGAFVPFVGAFADRHGPGRVLVAGALAYVAGLALMAVSTSTLAFGLSAGFMIGFALSGTTFGVVLGVVAKVAPPEKRSWALGLASAGGSFGQFAMVPIGQGLISGFGWFGALFALAFAASLIVPLAAGLAGRHGSAALGAPQTARQAIGEAVRQRSFHLLFWSYFVCGVHTAFIALHLPSYVQDSGMSAAVGMMALALIGFGNVFGSYTAGWLGGKVSKKWILTWLYGLRSALILVLLLVPKSPVVFYVFAFCMGLVWLSTVPLTNGLVAQIYGVRHVTMLSGMVFFGHQIGGFLGAWLGGVIATRQGSYDMAWWISIGLGIFAAIVCAPIDERPLARQQPATP